jgi:hypothetical protein
MALEILPATKRERRYLEHKLSEREIMEMKKRAIDARETIAEFVTRTIREAINK